MMNNVKTNKSVLHGLITINMEKVERLSAAATYTALWITYRLLIVAALIAGIATVAAGGDGRISDGNTTVVLISMAVFCICAICASIVRKLTNTAENNIKKLAKRRTK